ncbi:MAG: L,D-transpeptidase/peptidoglycan binding protein [Lachnospiraceae bacterium]|nr:L,D-transpeptidase/peptidoglycan binding protein [Lachnospiraceae bacterium]
MNMRKKSPHKILLCAILIPIGILFLVYLGFAFYFSSHFFYHTTINGIDVSVKKVAEAEDLLSKKISKYILELNGREDLQDFIYAEDVKLTFVSNGEVSTYLSEQNPLLWFLSIWNQTDKELGKCVSLDDDLLDETLHSLVFFQKENITKPKNAYIDYVKDQGYTLVPEILGTTLDQDLLYEHVREAILSGNTKLSLEDFYKNPKITATTEKLVNLYEKVSLYSGSKITYNFGKKSEVVDHSVIKDWLIINKKKYSVKIDSTKTREFVDYIGRTYNTFGSTRTFKGSNGHTISVSGGDYGWLLNREKETKDLMKLVKKGKSTTRKPAYTQSAVTHDKQDWGNTYVEVNLSVQHLWFYKNGKLIVDSDFVSGNIGRGNGTHTGVYGVTYKTRDAILGENSGADYRSPVSFWMPFNGNEGMHDASWRSKFGGSIYKTNGSHGCVNLPYSAAQKIYNNIEAGVAVVVFYE